VNDTTELQLSSFLQLTRTQITKQWQALQKNTNRFSQKTTLSNQLCWAAESSGKQFLCTAISFSRFSSFRCSFTRLFETVSSSLTANTLTGNFLIVIFIVPYTWRVTEQPKTQQRQRLSTWRTTHINFYLNFEQCQRANTTTSHRFMDFAWEGAAHLGTCSWSTCHTQRSKVLLQTRKPVSRSEGRFKLSTNF
jgi:hypothetical protein